MNRLVLMLLIASLSLMPSAAAFAAGGAVAEDLQLTLPSLLFGGQHYHLILDYVPDMEDGLYWRYNMVYPTNVPGEGGGVADGGLNIDGLSVMFAGGQYGVGLQYYQNPSDPSGLYWRLDSIEELPCSLTAISGPTYACYENIDLSCLLGCGNDMGCTFDCMGGVFQLAVEFTNASSTDQDCVLPRGATFTSDSNQVQNMMIIDEGPFPVPANSSSTFCIPTFCMNGDRAAPEETDSYRTGGVVTQPCLVEILGLTAGKNVDSFRVQTIIWECTEKGTLSAQDRAYLEGL